MIKIQLAHIGKSYLKFWHVPELSHSVRRSITPHKNTLVPLFCQAPCKLSKPPF